jgi:hypothetical protein
VNWFRALDPLAAEWLVLAIVIVLSFALSIGSSKLVWWLRTRKSDTDESEREYWHIHGG